MALGTMLKETEDTACAAPCLHPRSSHTAISTLYSRANNRFHNKKDGIINNKYIQTLCLMPSQTSLGKPPVKEYPQLYLFA